jgi:hypothetical protein
MNLPGKGDDCKDLPLTLTRVVESRRVGVALGLLVEVWVDCRLVPTDGRSGGSNQGLTLI